MQSVFLPCYASQTFFISLPFSSERCVSLPFLCRTSSARLLATQLDLSPFSPIRTCSCLLTLSPCPAICMNVCICAFLPSARRLTSVVSTQNSSLPSPFPPLRLPTRPTKMSKTSRHPAAQGIYARHSFCLRKVEAVASVPTAVLIPLIEVRPTRSSSVLPLSLSPQILLSTRCSCLLTLTDLARRLVLSSPPFERSVR